jgi:hypothetical protein
MKDNSNGREIQIGDLQRLAIKKLLYRGNKKLYPLHCLRVHSSVSSVNNDPRKSVGERCRVSHRGMEGNRAVGRTEVHCDDRISRKLSTISDYLLDSNW